MTRFVAVMHDDTVIVKDVEPRPHPPISAQWPIWFLEANLVISIDLVTGKTAIIKNRWGDSGDVQPKV